MIHVMVKHCYAASLLSYSNHCMVTPVYLTGGYYTRKGIVSFPCHASETARLTYNMCGLQNVNFPALVATSIVTLLQTPDGKMHPCESQLQTKAKCMHGVYTTNEFPTMVDREVEVKHNTKQKALFPLIPCQVNVINVPFSVLRATAILQVPNGSG